MSNSLAKQVKAWRLAQGMTQQAAADNLGISLATFQRIESGASCSDLTRAKIAKRIDKSKERERVAA
jgi:hypothetical protein